MKHEINHLKEWLDYDPEAGVFRWSKSNNKRAGLVAGTLHKGGYRRIYFYGVSYAEHRLAWAFTYGKWPENFIDHINGQRTDNRIANLRDVTRNENMQNQARPQVSNKSTGLMGATFNRAANKYAAQIGVHGKKIHLGCYDTAIEAHQAYVAAKAKYHPKARAIEAAVWGDGK
jgi:hypothetical protein